MIGSLFLCLKPPDDLINVRHSSRFLHSSKGFFVQVFTHFHIRVCQVFRVRAAAGGSLLFRSTNGLSSGLLYKHTNNLLLLKGNIQITKDSQFSQHLKITPKKSQFFQWITKDENWDFSRYFQTMCEKDFHKKDTFFHFSWGGESWDSNCLPCCFHYFQFLIQLGGLIKND